MPDDERDVSRIRKEIIANARTNMAIDEREQRINAKRQRVVVDGDDDESPPRKRKRSEMRDDDGNIRIVIYIPRFLRNIILVGWLIWFGLFPTIALLWSDHPGDVVYAPVFLILSVFLLFLTVMGWYLFWWGLGLHLTCGTVFLLAGLFAGAVEFSQLQELIDSIINRLR